MIDDKYFQLANFVLEHGELKETRAVLKSTGKRVRAVTKFGGGMIIDMHNPCAYMVPLLTTKEINHKAVIAELVWFMKGETNVKWLHKYGVRIWDDWADENGDVGPVYGKQWRNFNGVDQLFDVIQTIKEIRRGKPHASDRRLVVSAWNPPEIAKCGLPPCHTHFQFSVSRYGSLSLMVYMRSVDVFLGLPFNIASYGVLLNLVAHMTKLSPQQLFFALGDAHVYENHVDILEEQLKRIPYRQEALLQIDDPMRNVDDVEVEKLHIVDYKSQGSLRAEIAV